MSDEKSFSVCQELLPLFRAVRNRTFLSFASNTMLTRTIDIWQDFGLKLVLILEDLVEIE